MVLFIWNVQKTQIEKQEVDHWCEWGVTINGCEESYWGDENILKLIYDNGCTIQKLTPNHWIIHWKWICDTMLWLGYNSKLFLKLWCLNSG